MLTDIGGLWGVVTVIGGLIILGAALFYGMRMTRGGSRRRKSPEEPTNARPDSAASSHFPKSVDPDRG